jgi:hypothetical protein
MRDELRDGDDSSLAWSLLFGLRGSEPSAGEELGGPVGGDLVDDVDDVDVRVDAGELAVEQDGATSSRSSIASSRSTSGIATSRPRSARRRWRSGCGSSS